MLTLICVGLHWNDWEKYTSHPHKVELLLLILTYSFPSEAWGLFFNFYLFTLVCISYNIIFEVKDDFWNPLSSKDCTCRS